MEEAGVLKRLADMARASRSELGLLVLLGLAIIGSALVVILRTSDPPAAAVQRAAPDVAASQVASSPVTEPMTLKVHVAGQVAHPGVYDLPEGSRITDAISAAGGPLEGADANALNLAAPVTDGQTIALLKPGEAAPPDQVVAQQGGDAAARGKVNLNTATQAQLEELPGVGPVLAQRIIAHREKGRFTSLRQLQEVSGIGPKRFDDVKDLITV